MWPFKKNLVFKVTPNEEKSKSSQKSSQQLKKKIQVKSSQVMDPRLEPQVKSSRLDLTWLDLNFKQFQVTWASLLKLHSGSPTRRTETFGLNIWVETSLQLSCTKLDTLLLHFLQEKLTMDC